MRWIKSFCNWLANYAIENWVSIGIAISGFGGMTYLASISTSINSYGPVAWAASGIFATLILSIIYWVVASSRLKSAMAEFAAASKDLTTINPLAGNFSKRRIKLSDFYNPFFILTEYASFKDCELLGPENIIFIDGLILDGCVFHECEAVIVKEGATVIGATGMRSCTFERCKFIRVTFYMANDRYQYFKQSMGEFVPIISDGYSD